MGSDGKRKLRLRRKTNAELFLLYESELKLRHRSKEALEEALATEPKMNAKRIFFSSGESDCLITSAMPKVFLTMPRFVFESILSYISMPIISIIIPNLGIMSRAK